eukprot:TRINITY_DN831_c0_g1_i1.p2 TRINITY_DN831_c0_g1~~TRINITY_DN831_c0_g1_i1.p2  ORF type:complete len:198 (+),score=51.36 TRINITY_DN831_c0_g1_i1:263-856(+)
MEITSSERAMEVPRIRRHSSSEIEDDFALHRVVLDASGASDEELSSYIERALEMEKKKMHSRLATRHATRARSMSSSPVTFSRRCSSEGRLPAAGRGEPLQRISGSWNSTPQMLQVPAAEAERSGGGVDEADDAERDEYYLGRSRRAVSLDAGACASRRRSLPSKWGPEGRASGVRPVRGTRSDPKTQQSRSAVIGE